MSVPGDGVGPVALLEVLDLAIDWGRYGELYDFDANSGQLRLEHPAGTDPDREITNT